jgi:HSP20 family protein
MSQLTQNGVPESPALDTGAQEQAVTVHPRVDVLETEGEFLILADVPGVRPEDVDVRFERGELAFNGRRAAGGEFGSMAYHRTFAVADSVAADRITAELKSGTLTIHLPKVEAVKPKRIAVAG